MPTEAADEHGNPQSENTGPLATDTTPAALLFPLIVESNVGDPVTVLTASVPAVGAVIRIGRDKATVREVFYDLTGGRLAPTVVVQVTNRPYIPGLFGEEPPPRNPAVD